MAISDNGVDDTGVNALSASQVDIINRFKGKAKQKVKAYPEEFKAISMGMYSEGYTQQQIADTLSVSRTSVTAWLKSMNNTSDLCLSGLSDNIKRGMTAKLGMNANRLLSSLSDDKVEKASLRDLVVSFGVLYDKYRISSGEATEVIDHVYKKQGTNKTNVEDMEGDIIDISSKMKELND